MKKLIPILMIAFLVGEYVSGMNRICMYESAKGRHAITLSAVSICPISIEV